MGQQTHGRTLEGEVREFARLGGRIETYSQQLRMFEGTRPSPGGGHDRFDEVRAYRENVARLSLSTAAAIALPSVDRTGPDLDALCRILMQCQIIDDALDYDDDASAGLPSFLTAAESLSDARAWSAGAIGVYAAVPATSRTDVIFPFRVALRLFTLAAKIVLLTLPGAQHAARPHAHEPQ